MTTSSYSHVLGVPVAVAGSLYFVAMVALVSPPAWRVAGWTACAWSAAGPGVVSVIYLLWAELFEIDAICLWCTVVHVCTVWLFGAVLWYVTPASRRRPASRGRRRDRPGSLGGR